MCHLGAVKVEIFNIGFDCVTFDIKAYIVPSFDFRKWGLFTFQAYLFFNFYKVFVQQYCLGFCGNFLLFCLFSHFVPFVWFCFGVFVLSRTPVSNKLGSKSVLCRLPPLRSFPAFRGHE